MKVSLDSYVIQLQLDTYYLFAFCFRNELA